ncbi:MULTISPECIES: putative phage tail protein [Sorangium]|uniref:Uncharacterized protein n=1 Tax=Sorangium cellulosum TaxID=56 RepID=A0A4P2QPN6_SORCE|nr:MULTISPECIES: putative phage tail protein [Sorangium]AUX31916.1 uncharacterized protein SOCE836_040510 [Sorangium cellulosum]WCQ91290.1 hypothetical protein NQZ70_04006 [Sorangium sp. Soce836]
MPALGWSNPAPLELGGDPSFTEAIWKALRDALGKGGAGPEDSIEDLWRQAKAMALSAAGSTTQRAAVQAFPHLATNHIPVYEELLGIIPAPEASEEDRRKAITARWVDHLEADGPSLREAVQALDASADVETLSHDFSVTVHFGKAFGNRNVPNTYAGTTNRNGTNWPAYSTDLKVRVKYTLSGNASRPPRLFIEQLKVLLNERLPAWVDWYVTTGSGFYCDGGPDGRSLLNRRTLRV